MSIRIATDINGVEEKYRKMILKAVVYMESVIDSTEFKTELGRVIAESNELEGELSEWKKSTPELIYVQLLPISLVLRTFYTIRNTVGYGYENSKDIHLNTKFLSRYDIDDLEDLMYIGSNLLHEHGHDCGFSHDHEVTDRRPNSICYILNRAYERAFRQLYLPTKLEPAPVVKVSPWYVRSWSWIKKKLS